MKHHTASLLPILFFGCIVLLLGIGLLFVFEASGPESYLTYGDTLALTKQQGIGVLLGLIAFGLAIVVPTRWYLHLRYPIYALGILLLIATFLPGIGLELNGAHRWIHLGPSVFQPVEFMKFAAIVFAAGWMNHRKKIQGVFWTLGIPVLLLLLQPDLGSLLVLGGIIVSMYILAGGNLSQLGKVSLLLIPVFILLIIMAPYRLQRITTFMNPENDPQGSSFHVRQLTLALGRGGWFGQGIGNSSQKFSYVPEASTDSIAAIIGEETGFFGLLLLVCLYLGLLITSYALLSLTTGSRRLLGLGLLVWFFTQLSLNLAAVSALVPLTGIPLPLISYGRSSLLLLLFALGIVFRLYLEDRKKPA